jgi:hypothetical protein
MDTPTSIDLLAEQPRISLTALAQREGVHVATTARWALKGVRGHVLETLLVGSRRYTTREAFARWLAKLNDEPINAGETPRQRERSIDIAEGRLDRMLGTK